MLNRNTIVFVVALFLLPCCAAVKEPSSKFYTKTRKNEDILNRACGYIFRQNGDEIFSTYKAFGLDSIYDPVLRQELAALNIGTIYIEMRDTTIQNYPADSCIIFSKLKTPFIGFREMIIYSYARDPLRYVFPAEELKRRDIQLYKIREGVYYYR